MATAAREKTCLRGKATSDLLTAVDDDPDIIVEVAAISSRQKKKKKRKEQTPFLTSIGKGAIF